MPFKARGSGIYASPCILSHFCSCSYYVNFPTISDADDAHCHSSYLFVSVFAGAMWLLRHVGGRLRSAGLSPRWSKVVRLHCCGRPPRRLVVVWAEVRRRRRQRMRRVARSRRPRRQPRQRLRNCGRLRNWRRHQLLQRRRYCDVVSSCWLRHRVQRSNVYRKISSDSAFRTEHLFTRAVFVASYSAVTKSCMWPGKPRVCFALFETVSKSRAKHSKTSFSIPFHGAATWWI